MSVFLTDAVHGMEQFGKSVVLADFVEPTQ
jgi:hypothetical protein